MNSTAIEQLNQTDPFVDWTVDTERISRAAAEAFRTGMPDPWTLIEAECVLDLIDAELVALAARQRRGEPVQTSLRQLKAMRTEVTLAIKTLSRVEKAVDLTSGQIQDGPAGRQSHWPQAPDTGLQAVFINQYNPEARI